MKTVLYMHAGSGNHGCEALVRTTATLFNGPKDVSLWSFEPQQDRQYGAADMLERCVKTEEIKRFSPAYFETLFRLRIKKEQDAAFNVFLKTLFKNTVAVSIGGDNYCYPWSAKWQIDWNKKIRKVAVKNILWGCSIDAEAITEDMKADLAGYDLITARETITYETLKAINPNTKLVADPAFLLPTEMLPLPQGFVEGNTVGINVSPLVKDYGNKESIMANCETLIRHILDNTDMAVALIPHVVWDGNDDREPLGELKAMFADNDRVCMIEDANATQLKGYIARCRFFVGARTHATIAAYSSLVPTLVIGYSVKSRGIAKDLFGENEHYVLPVQSMTDDEQLCELFEQLQGNEAAVKEQLNQIVPVMKERALQAKKWIETL